MTGLKDLLKKREKIAKQQETSREVLVEVPEFTFKRTTTNTEEIIQPPSYPGDEQVPDGTKEKSTPTTDKKQGERRHHLGFRKASSSSVASKASTVDDAETEKAATQALPIRPGTARKLSERLHLHRERSRSTSELSTNLPEDLPEPPLAVALTAHDEESGNAEQVKEAKAQREAQWEKRATLLARSNPLLESQQPDAVSEKSHAPSTNISSPPTDDNIHEAIRLHESGVLAESTSMFGRLASPTNTNNALAQVLYGLALRHGWGVPPNPTLAIHFLSLAAANSASIEEQALLASGMQQGGAAKGELVLAIFELANCFRFGWGVKRDAVAARQYYETAANLGDADAMEEVAWCLLEGFGGGRDKVSGLGGYCQICHV